MQGSRSVCSPLMAKTALTHPLQDKIAQDKGKEHRQRDLARQEQLRAMLDSQMQDVERQRQAEAQQRREVSLLCFCKHLLVVLCHRQQALW